MKKRIILRAVLFAVIVAAVVLAAHVLLDGKLDFETFKHQRLKIRSFVEANALLANAAFFALVFLTALVLPGALVLSIAGGFLFGVIHGVILINIGATTGAVFAFWLSRLFIGRTLQEHYASRLNTLNNELKTHGYSYLLVLRIVPIMPFFMVNYLAGLTRIKPWTFIWTTSLGLFPGSLVFAYAGRQASEINSPNEILSTRMIAAMVLLAFAALLPVVVKYVKKATRG